MVGDVGVALLSFSHAHQRAWARSVDRDPRGRVVAVWDDNQARGEGEARRLGVPFQADLDAVLADRSVDAVTICAENSKHAGLAVAAAQAGKHIMMQKPMATTMSDCDRIVAAVEEAGVTYMQSFNLRFDPVHELIHAMLEAGELGQLSVVRRRHSHHFALDPVQRRDVLGWMTDPRMSGGGALMDEGAHAALWFVWMFGVPVRVSAEVGHSTAGMEVEDHAVITYRYPDEMIGVHQSSWTEVSGDATVEIFGERGTIVATGGDIASTRGGDITSQPVKIFRAGSGRWEHLPVELRLDRADLVVEPFLDCLVQGAASPVPPRWGRAAVEMILAAYRSSADGAAVRLGSSLDAADNHVRASGA